MTITDAELEEWLRLYSVSTDCEWRCSYQRHCGAWSALGPPHLSDDEEADLRAAERDGRFIEVAREAVPRLIAELKEARRTTAKRCVGIAVAQAVYIHGSQMSQAFCDGANQAADAIRREFGLDAATKEKP